MRTVQGNKRETWEPIDQAPFRPLAALLQIATVIFVEIAIAIMIVTLATSGPTRYFAGPSRTTGGSSCGDSA